MHRYRALAALAALLIVACSWYPPIQQVANEQVDAGLKRAVVSFASARALNAAISVLQGTSVSAQPLGVGVTFTLGEVLDPINDLVERFSEWMLIASVAFGVQKMLLLIGSHWAVSALVSALAVWWAVLFVYRRAPPWLSRLLVVLLMVRFAIPAVTLGSDFVFRQMLADDYAQSQAYLELAARQVDQQAQEASRLPPGADRSLWEKLKEGASAVASSIRFDEIRKSAEGLPERIVTLIAIFFLQTILIPVALLWALYRIAVALGRGSGARPRVVGQANRA
jgi:hypothetical protein